MSSTGGFLRVMPPPPPDDRRPLGPEVVPPSEGASEWVRFTHSLWHSRWLIVACVIVSMVLATAYNYTARPLSLIHI